MGPEDSEGPPDPEAFAALCAEQQTQGECDAVPSEYYPWEDAATWCYWAVSVPVTLSEGVCEFGEPSGACVGNSASEIGCPGGGGACHDPRTGDAELVEGQVVLTLGDSCARGSCQVDGEGNVLSGLPECACFCDPGFPSPASP